MTENQKQKSVQPSDPDIVAAIRRGDEEAFEKTFRLYYPRLCNYAASLLKDDEEAEEAVQTVFLTIWEKREDLEITLSLKSYLYRAVHNHCLNRFKHASVREVHREHTMYFSSGSYDSVTEVIHANELEERIEKAVSTLPEQCQKAFRMSRFEELKYQEIADQLGISIKTVENQIGKALKILRLELADYLPSMLWPVYLFVEQLIASLS
ncbi:RNA polymerase sigma-H factor [Dyadobacter sp. CECT 9623]|uniref:RNA polymerase sigma-H factor n=1 Tax=Dyadobacter linearis TaxID=2823330 RepID=A0ABM8UT29_9BACT|nr:RNA polymerase sigma-H factor [Dyadobacter sp. CECT 9623]